jgi:16S rRNA (guanine966-N2)-methyltransferase
MRIIAGRLRGRPLVAPAGKSTRPTSERAREALFNILEHAPFGRDLAGARVLDLFAGSGALGLEAISRGAAFCLFVDTDEAARGAIRANIDALGLFGITRLHRRSATDLGKRPAGLASPFDLVFLDPPYSQGLGEAAIARLVEGGWVTPDALVVFECSGDEDPQTPGWTQLDARDYGAARVLFLRADQ